MACLKIITNLFCLLYLDFSRKVLLWCEEGQSRSAADVTAYDVIFQAALDVEKELR